VKLNSSRHIFVRFHRRILLSWVLTFCEKFGLERIWRSRVKISFMRWFPVEFRRIRDISRLWNWFNSNLLMSPFGAPRRDATLSSRLQIDQFFLSLILSKIRLADQPKGNTFCRKSL
jgi:hypothetical protein